MKEPRTAKNLLLLSDYEKWRFLMLTDRDMRDAAEAAKWALRPQYWRVLQAFVEVATVRYGRPFSSNRFTRLVSLPSSYLASFTAEEQAVHEEVIRCRDESFAHSDNAGVEFYIVQEARTPSDTWPPRKPLQHFVGTRTLKRDSLQMLPKLIAKIRAALAPELERFANAPPKQ